MHRFAETSGKLTSTSATGPCYATSRSTNAQGGRRGWDGIMFSAGTIVEKKRGVLSGKRENNSNVR